MIINGDVMDKHSLWHRLIVWLTLAGTCLYQAYLLLSEDEFTEVSYAAHVAGGFTGLFLGTFVLINYKEQDWEKKWQYISIGIYAMAFVEILVMSAMKIHRHIDEDSDYSNEDQSMTAGNITVAAGNLTVSI